MESAPPSYEAATLSDVLTVIAPYIHTSDLYAATLVSKRFFKSINSRLWGNPALHIGLEHDGIDDFLARFQKTLTIARPSVRSLVHTLHIPSSQALYFDDRPADWLAQLLQLLPSLQSLVVQGLRNFDHAALQALVLPGYRSHRPDLIDKDKAGDLTQPVTPRPGPSSSPSLGLAVSLKHLNAAHCVNLTVSSLSQALPSFASLICLDLSFSTAARHPDVLKALASLWHLKILRLQNIGLTDDGCMALAGSVSRRVASLDLSGNLLTDKSVGSLVNHCIGDTPNYDYTAQLSSLRPADLAIYRSANMEASVIRSLTQGFVNRLAIEDLNEQGITHLYLADNQLTSQSLQPLLQQRVLNVLDIANADATTPGQWTEALLSVDNTLVHLRTPYHVLKPSNAASNGAHTRSSFQPSLFPRMQKLILTAFPQFSSTAKDVSSIIALIEQCALEAQLARQKAMQDYTLPPGRHGSATALRAAASSIFALQTIVLEIAATSPASHQPQQKQQQQHTKKDPSTSAVTRHEQHSSFTDDADSESLWKAAEDDFSFFRDGDDNQAGFTGAGDDDRHRRESLAAAPRQRMQERVVDNLALLSTFRQQRRLARERDVQSKGPITITPGFWDGVIEIVRP